MPAIESKLPEALQSVNESHKFLRSYKKTWEKRYKHTRMESIFEGVDLAHYLVALDRTPEAVALLHYLVDNQVFTGNYNIWTPVGYGIILMSRLLRLSGDREGHAAYLQRIRCSTFRADYRDGDLDECLESHRRCLEGVGEMTQRWACHSLSRNLMQLEYFAETASGAGFPHSGLFETTTLEKAVDASYCLLRVRLK
jgi:hypothetical protein